MTRQPTRDRRHWTAGAGPGEPPRQAPHGMVWLPGGQFTMGSDTHYPEERPAHRVRVDGFFADTRAVSNREFARFVADTGYVTIAERYLNPANYPGAASADLVPGALVFRRTKGSVPLDDYRRWWEFVPGAHWRRPEGPDSSIDGREDHPVVQVAYADVLAYARWAGKALPTEAQWEYAARGGLEGAEYAWGEEFMPDGEVMANTWHGRFPWENLAPAGVVGTMPGGSFPANGYGLYDVCGNVWEWTRDWYAAHAAEPGAGHAAEPAACCAPVAVRENPRGGKPGASIDPAVSAVLPRRTVKGGSWLCAPSYCLRYRPAARQPQTIDTATNHLGFRCVLIP